MKRNIRKWTAATSALMTILSASAASATTLLSFQPQAEAAVQNTAGTYRNVMYYGDWAIWGGEENFYPDQLPADELTHLNFAFVDFDENGNLLNTDADAAFGHPLGQEGVTFGDITGGLIPAFNTLRAKNPNLKIGISVGGWSKSKNFALVAANPTARANFVKNILAFLKYTNMDFVDIDWEYPTIQRTGDTVDNKGDTGTPYASPADRENFITLMTEIRAGLDQQGPELDKSYELSCALPASKKQLSQGVDVAALFKVIDFANIMTYDMNGAWSSYAGHHSALYSNPNEPDYAENGGLSADSVVQYLKANGAPSDKIVLGAAFYSRGWNTVAAGSDTSQPGLWQTASVTNKDADQSPSPGANNYAPLASGDGGRAGGLWPYRKIEELKAKNPDLKEYWDDIAKAPYLYSAKTGEFYTYDNIRSVTEKTSYVRDNGLGGMISWAASQDKDSGSGKRDELTSTIKTGLYGASQLPQYEISQTNVNVDVKVNFYEQQWGTGKGYQILITNNEENISAGRTNDILQQAKAYYSTVKLPTFYIYTKTGETLTKDDYLTGDVSNQAGVAKVDLAGVYDAKMLTGGKTQTLKLVSNSQEVTPENITKIVMTQRNSKNGPEISQQVIYSSEDAANPENTAPVLKGVGDKSMTVGDEFDALAGITATDKEDGDLTSKITVKGSVDTTKAGKYELVYSVKDSAGKEVTAKCVVTVKAKPEVSAPVLQGVTDQTITVGDKFDALAGITATDKVDGDLTAKITMQGSVDTAKPGTYELVYSVKNTQGKETTAKSVVTVKPKMPQVSVPVLSGTENKTIKAGEVFDAKRGVTAYDAVDGDLTSKITAKAGTVGNITQIVYTVTNSQNKTTTAIRYITMVSKNTEFIKGISATSVNAGGKFEPLRGVTAVDANKNDVTSYLTTSGTVDTNKAGTYTITYTLDAPTVYNVEKRVITVTDYKPYFVGLADKTLTVGESFDSKAGVTAFDRYGVDITNKIYTSSNLDTSKAGEYVITYKVYDKYGRLQEKTIKVTVKAKAAANTAPVLNGLTDKTLTVGDKFDALAGITAVDQEDGDLTSKITVSGTVDTGKVGKYELVYKVIDSLGLAATGKRTITVKAKATAQDPAAEMVNPTDKVLVGYWHNWPAGTSDGYQRGNSAAMKLTDIPEGYNVVNVSFMIASNGGNIPTFKPYNMTDEEFRQEVGQLNEQGRSVLIALGGADAHIELTPEMKEPLVQELIRLVDVYGFDGLDIDLEQSAITAGSNSTVLPEVLKEVKDYYKAKGQNFIITMAPEFPHLRKNSAYVPYITKLEGYYDWINPQFYNQGGDGVSEYGGYAWLAQNNDSRKADFLYSVAKHLIDPNSNTFGVTIPADKLVLGLPSNSDAAATGYVTKASDVESALTRLAKEGQALKGLMTWSVNWDNGKSAAGKSYNWEFVTRYAPMLFGSEAVIPETPVAPEADKEAPTVPTNLTSSNVTQTSATIAWKASTDNVGVAGYRIYRNGTEIAKVSATTYTDAALKANTSYQYTIKAYDAAGNLSNASATLTVKTKEATAVDPSNSTWDKAKIYLGGETVLWNGKEYTAQWWTQGDEPGTAAVWKEKVDSAAINPWNSQIAYTTGQKVVYQGQIYEAQWWTQGDVPGTTSVWKVVG